MGDKYKFKTEDDGNLIHLIGFLVILIILVGGVLYLILTSAPAKPDDGIKPIVTPPVTKTPYVENETNETVFVCDDHCLYDKAILEENADQCKLIGDDDLAQECFEQLADVSLQACLEVDDGAKKVFCVTSFAVATDNIDLCDLIDEGRTECKQKVDECIGSENEDLCRALEKSDPSLCKYDTDCLMNYSLSKNDAAGCDLIQNSVVAKACESSVKKTDKCYDLSLKAERDYCYQIYAINTNDYKTCTSISQFSIYRLNCLSMFAAMEGNYTICTKGDLQLDDLWACYTNYSLISGDISGCEQIHELATTNRFNCAFEFAKKYGNAEACMVIKSLASRDTCYQGVIIYSNENLNPEYCDGVTDFIWRNKCYNEAAIKYDDVSLCDNIGELYAKNACVDAYNLAKED